MGEYQIRDSSLETVEIDVEALHRRSQKSIKSASVVTVEVWIYLDASCGSGVGISNREVRGRAASVWGSEESASAIPMTHALSLFAGMVSRRRGVRFDEG